jgi:hypothetical protein
VIAFLRRLLPSPEPRYGICWFCKHVVAWDFLIAGYDDFEEQRLACLDCDKRQQHYETDWEAVQPYDEYTTTLVEPRSR